MSANASANSSDGAPSAGSRLSSSPFSPHATAFGPGANIYPVADASLLSDPAYAHAAGLLDPLVDSAPAPTSGPLSASDPRTQLLVSNLPYRVRWQDLKDLFRKAGTVLRADVSLSPDNRSRGYGTVLMATEQDAIKAADMLGGFTWQGRTLDVRVDRSGALLGVAGSAVMPTIVPHGLGGAASSSPNAFGNGPPAPSLNSFSHDSHGGAQQYLGVPGGSLGSSQGPTSGSFSGAASPSPLSAHARLADPSQPISSRASFSAHSEAGRDGAGAFQQSELERALLQGQSLSSTSGKGTPDRQQPGTHFEPGSAGQAQHRAVSAVQSLSSHGMGSRRGSESGVGMAGAPQSGVWGPSVTDAASSMYSSNAGGSSVPTGFPGATAMAPWPAGPGSFGAPAMASVQSQPFNSQMPTTSYAGRVLFVGNLPFHCQWQDLKDLFRAAGNIQRADVAIGPDGRSRGFGTVLFTSQEDAQNAVRLYHGYEYSGRTLKVHFDRFAAQNGPAVGTPGNPAQYTGAFAAAALPSHMTNNSFGLFAQSNGDTEEESQTASSRDKDHGMSIAMPVNDFGAASSYLPSDLMSPGLVSPPVPTQYDQSAGAHPGRIQLPSSTFANSFGAALGGAQASQMSPMTAGMQVPMTLGMPGFTFHQVAETPPLYPQFLSPGLDPFSPVTGSGAQDGGPEQGAPMNASTGLTPGAPVGYNPMFAMAGGFGGAYGSNQQPATPHWSQPSGPRRQGGGGVPAVPRRSIVAHNPDADEVVDSNRLSIAKTPGAGPRRPSHADVGNHSLHSRRASDGTPAAVEPSMSDGYPFPLVAAGNVSHLTRRASMDSPAQTPLASGPSATSGSAQDVNSAGSMGSDVPSGEILAGTSAEELANTIARLSVKGTALARDSSSRRSVSMTAERTAAASAMAKLRGKAGTPTPPAVDESSGATGLGAPFAESTQQQPPRLGLEGRTHESSPLGKTERLLGLRVSSSALDGSALDTGSDAGANGAGSR
uniref:RRM domain-containing protein n=1 Tax=Kalmanozyma brasiliensis (strain GHG001) TaxID=1365824 RepID=V5EU81_KALBG